MEYKIQPTIKLIKTESEVNINLENLLNSQQIHSIKEETKEEIVSVGKNVQQPTPTVPRILKKEDIDRISINLGAPKDQIVPRTIVGKTRKWYKCQRCDYLSQSIKRLLGHFRTHTGERPYQCPSCNYAGKQERQLVRHLSIHAPDRVFKCKLCEFTAFDQKELVVHNRTHSNKEKPFKCHLCSHATLYKRHLLSHIARHGNDTTVKCDEPDDDNPTKQKRLRSSNNSTNPYQCARCSYTAIRKTSIIAHLMKNGCEKNCFCSMCDFSTVNRSTLKEHMAKKHNTPKSVIQNHYICGVCQYSTDDNVIIRAHMGEHQSTSKSGNIPYIIESFG